MTKVVHEYFISVTTSIIPIVQNCCNLTPKVSIGLCLCNLHKFYNKSMSKSYDSQNRRMNNKKRMIRKALTTNDQIQ